MRNKPILPILLILLLVIVAGLAHPSSGTAQVSSSLSNSDGESLTGAGTVAAPSNAPLAPLACSTPTTATVRGKAVEFDQCYEHTFTHDGTDFTVYAYYTEVNSTTNLNQCDADENDDGRCEHALADDDDGGGNNVQAVGMAAEVEGAIRFYRERNLQFLAAGVTEFTIYIAEDPRGGGIVPPNSIYTDDELLDTGDVLWKRLLALHEIQHLVQDKYDDLVGWRSFYGEGIARAIEDRVDTTLDADSGHLFIPEINNILTKDDERTSDITTISYRSAFWWTWLMDRYKTGAETDPVTGWVALRDFYLELKTESDQVKALRDFIASQGSNFDDDFIDYTLALYAYRFNPSDPRLGVLDPEINATAGLQDHNVITGGPSFGTVSASMNPRSSRYWEFNPASQCDYVAFSFDGNGQTYAFSVMTVDGGNLAERWTSYSTDWMRTVRSADLDRVVGVVTAVDNSGTVDVSRGCVQPTVDIKHPTTAAFEMVGLADNPRHFITRLEVEGADDSAVAGLLADDFQVQIRKAGGGSLIDATVVNATYVQDDYWLLVQAPSDADGAESGAFYDLIVTLGSEDDVESSALLYVERTQDSLIVLDRSGSMGGGTGKIEAARNAANLLVNELSGDDQGAFVSFDQDAYLREGLDTVTGTHRTDLYSAIAAETPGGATSIGDGLLTAADEHDANGIADNLCSFVLLSDGHENDPQYWADVKAQIIDNGCAIHAIALGPGTNELLMQQIAASTPGGSYDFATASGGVPILNGAQAGQAVAAGFLGWENNLSRVYDFKAAQIAGRQRLSTVNGGPSASACVGFEDLVVGTQYPVGSLFMDSGAKISGKTFYWSDGTPYSGGYAEVGNDGLVGGSGNELQVNNINLAFDFGGPIAGLSLRAFEGGGNLNLEINGDFRNFNRFDEIDGLTIGGVQVTATALGNNQYSIELKGTIDTFALGGQELWIDDVCPVGEDGLLFYVDDASDELVVAVAWQTDSGGDHTIQLYDPNGDPVSTGYRRLSPTGTNEVWQVPAPQSGFWRLVVEDLGQEFFVSASARTHYQMYLFIGSPISTLSQGVKVPLLVTFVAKDQPLLGAEVVATVRDPGGLDHVVQLLDDGNHGDGEADDGVYGGFYTATSLADQIADQDVGEGQEPQVVGSYLVNAVGTKGDLRREAQGSFAIQGGRDDDQDRLPDEWERRHGLDPDTPEEDDDPDRDELFNYCEYKLGTHPLNSDTDDGGESDGSETGGLCYPTTQDPLDPSDDRSGPLSHLVAWPIAPEGLPRIRVLLGRPLWGELSSVDLYRRTYTDTGTLVLDWEFISTTAQPEFVDEEVQDGWGYAYLARPTIQPTMTGTMSVTGRLLSSNLAPASDDPYPPGGSILINDGISETESLTVALSLAVDDSGYGHTHGDEGGLAGGSPSSEIMMRLSNSPDFDAAAWQPFQSQVTGWHLGDVAPGELATVYVQFQDAKGNVSQGGFAQVDTIRYKQVAIPSFSLYLPIVVR